ncbi:MAG: hypothetical protein ABIQ89_02260 [Candidatus Saccharimonadales bacterium]
MPIRNPKQLSQTGDTIVEVLIVIIVLGVVVSAGYRTAIRSLQSIQLSQEKTYALKLAEGQLESIKAKATQDPTILSASGYCLDSSLNSQTISPAPTNGLPDNYVSYPVSCKVDPNGGSCTGLCYYVGVRKVSDNSITASVRWDGYAGKKQQVELSYRLYQ